MKTLQELKDIKAAKHGQIDIRFNPDNAEAAENAMFKNFEQQIDEAWVNALGE